MKQLTINKVLAGFAIVAAFASPSLAATATVDVEHWHQMIRGFGLSTAWSGRMTPTEADQIWDTIKGAGLSLNRVMIDRDGLGPEETDNAISATNRGAKVWGTPWFTKGGVNVGDYDTLYEKDYQEWANTLANMAIRMKGLGAPMYAISSGNEIDLGWTKYSREALAVFVGKYLGPTLAEKAPETKIIGIEPCNWYGFDWYFSYFKNDSDAWKYSSILATHEYGGSPKAYPEIHSAGKEFWQTEIYDTQTDVEDVGMGSALRVYTLIHEALTIADMNAWHFWWKNPCSGCYNGAIWAESTKQPTKRLWMMGNFSRYARPGFIRIEAPVEPTTGVFLSAYRDSSLSKVVVVIANKNNNVVSQTISIPGVTPSKVIPAITDPTRDLVELAPINTSSSEFTYDLPAQSVVSLVFDLGKPIPAHRDTVFNGGFDDGTKGWNFNTWGSTAQGSVSNGEYKIDISSLGTANSSIQLVQNGIILQQGKSYEVTFDAYASANRSIEANVELDVSPWTSYLSELKYFNLTTTKQTFQYSFDMTNPTDSNGRIAFNIGASTIGLFLDNISIKEVAGPVFAKEITSKNTFASVQQIGSYLQITIPFSLGSTYSIDVYDIKGKQVRHSSGIDGGNPMIWSTNISNLGKGNYFIHVQSNGSKTQIIPFRNLDLNYQEKK